MKRNNKISTKDVFYYTSQLIKNKNASSTTVTSKMYNEKICNATASSFIKKRNKIPFTYFQVRIAKQLGGYDISNKLLEYHYSATIYHVALQHNIFVFLPSVKSI